MHITLVVLAVSAVLSGAMLSGAVSANDNTTIDLNFNWPETLVAQVNTTIETTTLASEQESRMSMTSTAELHSIQRDELYVIEMKNQHTTEFKDDGRMPDISRFLMEQFSSITPSTKVSLDGNLQSVTSHEEIANQIIDNLMSNADDQSDEVLAVIAQLIIGSLSDELIFAMAQQSWDRMVGRWQGVELKPGNIHEIHYEAPVELPDIQSAPAIGYLEFLGHVHCTDATTAKSCVSLKFNSALHPDFRTKIESSLQEEWNLSEDQLIKFDIEHEQYMVTNPDTLVPHRFVTTSKTYGVHPIDGTQTTRTEKITTTFDYLTP